MSRSDMVEGSSTAATAATVAVAVADCIRYKRTLFSIPFWNKRLLLYAVHNSEFFT